MNRIEKCFEDLNARGDKALVCFLTCGDPDFSTTTKLVAEIARSGADIIELGVPFSDPMADGPSIQASSCRALDHGATVKGVLNNIKEIRTGCDVPIVLMTYFNPVNKYGLERFANDAAQAGADGVILTDLPPEEAGEWKKAAESAGLSTIFLLAPTSTKDRIELVSKMGSGFTYCVSRTGVTGARNDMPAELESLVNTIKASTKLPVVVGFGISTPEHVKFVTRFADGAVIGSALVNIIASHNEYNDLAQSAGEFVKSLKAAVVRRE